MFHILFLSFIMLCMLCILFLSFIYIKDNKEHKRQGGSNLDTLVSSMMLWFMFHILPTTFAKQKLWDAKHGRIPSGFAHYYNFCPCLLLCCSYWGAYAPQEHKRQKAKVVIQNKLWFHQKIKLRLFCYTTFVPKVALNFHCILTYHCEQS